MMKKNSLIIAFISLLCATGLFAQNRYELNSDWKCRSIKEEKASGEDISSPSYTLSGWKNAVVPGTVLTTMLANKEIPDPFYGMNNEQIPDIYKTGRDYYTYWFVKNFKEEQPENGDQVWLKFRGINYSCRIYLNGKLVNKEPYEGMYLRKSFNITKLLSKTGDNRLAVIVFPPDPVGNPNGGQGGDGTIARGVSHQYVAGWDWIRPIRDRNTGIWDKVYIEKTGSVNLSDPHIITQVPGKRIPEGKQSEALIKVSTEVENASDKVVSGVVKFSVEGNVISKEVTLEPNSKQTVSLPVYKMQNPRLWWPSGYGEQNLYKSEISFEEKNKGISDSESVQFGVREIQTQWNPITSSREIHVNGQKIFIKGGNWIISDAMLRFTPERYDAEIRYHRDMNLNLIRIWGGALVERPEFYEACDRYGMLVFQDFWMSGDCNGRWLDPLKKEDQWIRRNYPDNHSLFLECAADMVKMVRNHPSLAIWCGGNEIAPPDDILTVLRDSIIAKLDGTRMFFDFSNTERMSLNTIGGNGDGPYSIQPLSVFWNHKTWPFNSEVGSVGVGDYESLKRFIPEKNMVLPVYHPNEKPNETADSVWTYHTYTGVGYEGFLEPYGTPSDIKDFCMKAQLVNYDQYRGLMEGFSSHMWNWYTGVIIWKTQNPWTAMRGQMYDYYLDPNACLFGLRNGSEKLHAMCSPVDGTLMLVNNGFKACDNLTLTATWFDMDGKSSEITQQSASIDASSSKKLFSIKKELDALAKEKGGFLRLQLMDESKQVLSENIYWLADGVGKYSGLSRMNKAKLKVSVKPLKAGKVEVTLSNPASNPVAFFNRVSVVDKKTGERVLPVFYSDNYCTIVPSGEKKIEIECNASSKSRQVITVAGWNVELQEIIIPKIK